MRRTTGRTETEQTSLAWLRPTRSARDFSTVKQILEGKISKSNPRLQRMVQDQLLNDITETTKQTDDLFSEEVPHDPRLD